MISYRPLWETMKRKGISTYYLRNNSIELVNGSTILRLKAGESVSTNTLDTLCRLLDCDLTDIVEYIKNE